VDPGYPKPISPNWNWGAFGANGIKAPLYSGGPFVTPPAAGLSSNNNYFLADGGAALTGVTATMIFDVEFESSANGYSFQLNGYSTHGSSTEWQQFVIYNEPGQSQLWARIETWAGTQLSDELNRIDVPLTTLSGGKIPMGYSMTMAPITDSSNRVSGCTFTVTNAQGQQVATQTLTIVGQILRNTGKPATSANLAPLAAFTFNVGGDGGGTAADLTSALGTITYTSNNALTAVNAEPSYTDFNDNTAETANIAYGPLPQSANFLVTQSFYQIAAPSQAQARVYRKSTHHLPPRDRQSMGRHSLQPRLEEVGAK
jgi:hypothetical protein